MIKKRKRSLCAELPEKIIHQRKIFIGCLCALGCETLYGLSYIFTKTATETAMNCFTSNLAVLLSPFLPFSSEKVLKWLDISSKWKRQSVASSYVLPETQILFQRIDKNVIEEETEKLKLGDNSNYKRI